MAVAAKQIPSNEVIEERISRHFCIHYHVEKNGLFSWCPEKTAAHCYAIFSRLEDVSAVTLHPIMSHCIGHLSPQNVLRAKTTEILVFDQEKSGWTELILWQSGEPKKRLWNFCFNHHEECGREWVEWNTVPFLHFLTKSAAKAHAYELYEKYGRDTPMKRTEEEEEMYADE